jgi:hypothetical protein
VGGIQSPESEADVGFESQRFVPTRGGAKNERYLYGEEGGAFDKGTHIFYISIVYYTLEIFHTNEFEYIKLIQKPPKYE